MTITPQILQGLSGNLDFYPDEGEEPFIFQAANSVLFGHGKTRPMRVIPNSGLAYWSIKEPLYDSTHQLNLYPNGIVNPSAAYTLYGVAIANPGTGVMVGTNVSCKEVFVSEIKGERSLAGTASTTVDLSANQLVIISNSVAPSTEKFITHREFYLNFQDTNGAYYLAARVPYTGGSDHVTVNVTADVNDDNRPLEEKDETSIFPAVSTAAYWRSRVWAARLVPRKVKTATYSGPTVTLTNGSTTATLSAAGWREDDVYKGIVNYATGEIVAYVERILTSTTARIRTSNAVTSAAWPYTTVTLTNWGLSGDTSTVFCSPIYVGEAAGGVTLSPTTWCPLNQILDENLQDAGSEIRSIWAVEDYLVIVSDRAILMYQGDVSVDNPPTPRIVPLGTNVGSFNPRAAWNDASGQLWFQGQGRIFTTSGGVITDVTANIACTSFYEKFVDVDTLTGQRTSYNPELNAALIVNLSRTVTGDTLMLYIDHASGKIYGLTFPIAVTSVLCSATDTGRWQWWIGAGKYLYRFMVRGLTVDTYRDADDTLHAAAAVPYSLETGYKPFPVRGYTVAFELLHSSLLPQDCTLEIQAASGQRLPDSPFAATYSQDITGAELDSGQVGLCRLQGKAFRWRLSGDSQCAFELYEAHMLYDSVEQDQF